MADVTINGTSGDDIIETTGENTDHEVNAGAGNDFIVDGGGTGSDDIFNGDAGDDNILGGSGNDTIDGGVGNDTVLGSEGDDTLLLNDNFGEDRVTGGEFQEITGDVLDASGMTTDATLTFGVDITVASDGGGPPGGGGGPPGGGGDGGGGPGDGGGDTVVKGATLASGTNFAEILEIESYVLGSGNDTVIDDDGDNIVNMGAGDDQFQITDAFGQDTLTGGEGGETDGDLVDGSALTAAATVTFTGDGVGTLTDGTNTVTFTEVERAETGAGADTVYGGSGTESVATNDGDDVFFFGDNFGNDIYVGGEGGETTGDTLDGTALTDAVTVAFTSDGGGTLSDGTDTMAFSEMEQISTGFGDDTVTGGTGNDTVNLNHGDDTFAVLDNFGNDTVDGGAGGETNGDFLDGSGLTTDATLILTTEDDGTLTSGTNTVNFTDFERFETGAGNDTVIGSASDDTFATNAGDDTVSVTAGSGTDTWDAGEGGETTGDTLDATALNGDTTVTFNNDGSGTLSDGIDGVNFQDVEVVLTGAGNDTITGSTGDETVAAGAGDDTFQIADGFGNDDLDAGETAETSGDRLDGSALTAGVTVTLTDAENGTISDGTDTLSFAGFEILETGSGNDTIVGSNDDDTIATNGGDDRFTLANGFGTDTFSAGSSGETTGDTIDGSALTDDTTVSFTGAQQGTLSAGTDSISFDDVERIETGSGNDTIASGAGDNSVATNAGDDTFIITDGFGTDSFDAGEGGETTGDRLDATGMTANATVTLTGDGDGTLTQGSNNVSFTDVELIETGSGDDDVTGGTGNDSVATGAGDDSFSVLDGFGDDIVDLGETGETNGDTLDGSGLTSDVTLNLAGGDAGTLSDGSGTVTFSGAENVETGAGDDVATGSSDDDTVDLNQGDDRFIIAEGFGNDSVDFGEGNQNNGGDTLDATGVTSDLTVTFTSGESGNATDGTNTLAFSGLENVETGSGNDTIISGSAGDNVSTNGGDDTFVVTNNFGNDQFDAGETSETTGDSLDASGVTSDITLNFSGAEQGSLSSQGDTLNFSGVESVTTGSGYDTITSGAGNDSVSSGAGDDVYILNNGFGDDTFDAGTGNEFDGDLVDGSNLTGDTTVTFTADGEGTLVDGADTLTFSNIEGVATGSGNDTIFGGTGDDVILAQDGDDTLVLTGNFGSDAILGGEGGESTGDKIDAGAITDDVTISFSGNEEGNLTAGTNNALFFEIEEIETGAGNDTFTGSSGNERIIANAGDDTFNVADNFGTDSFEAGSTGETTGDRIDASAMTAGATVALTGTGTGTLSQGANTLTFDGIEAIETGSGADTITGSSGNDTIVTNEGDDTLIVSDGFGDDTIAAGGGSDHVDGSALSTDATVNFTSAEAGTLSSGTDSVDFDDVEAVSTGSGNDTIIGSSGAETVSSGAGDDTFTINDGFGNDDLDAGSGGEMVGDTLDAGGLSIDATVQLNNNGTGSISAGGSTASLRDFENFETGTGNDTVSGSSRDETVSTGVGDDTFVIDDGFGDDSFDAGEGGDVNGDTIDASQVNSDINVNFSGNEDGTLTAGSNSLAFDNVENVVTGSGDDTFIGSTGNESVSAGTGDDTFVISDGFGQDTFNAGEGGFTSGDTIDGSALTDDATVRFNADEDGFVRAGTNQIDFTNVEIIETGSGNDTVFGDVGDDRVNTGAGDDRIIGLEGRDTFDTGAGDDTIFFAEGDSIDGGSGDDEFLLRDYGETSNNTITIDGGSENTIAGDVLRLGRLADLTTLNVNGLGNGSVTLKDGTLLNFTDIETVICFTPGTMIATPFGPRDIADLKIGDRVLTRDNGIQPIRWIQSRTVPACDRFAPIRIRPGVLTDQAQDLVVSPQHRMLFEGYRAELLFGESEVLVSAKHLVDGRFVTQDEGGDVTYIHMMCDKHEVVFANGAASESFHPGAVGLTAVSDEAREELFALFPELRSNPNGYGPTARRCLRKHETQLLSA